MNNSIFEDESIDHSNIILSYDGSSKTLSCPESWKGGGNVVKWETCADIDGTSLINSVIKTGETFETSEFTNPSVNYYKCYLEDKPEEFKVFAVGYTGLQTIEITTDDGKRIESKTFYKGGMLNSYKKSGKSDVSGNITVKCRGNASYNHAIKKSYTVKFEDKTSILGMKKSKKWCLLASQFDDSFLSVRYATYLSNNVFTNSGLWEPSSKSVNLVVNGQYEGTYSLIEPIKIEKNRVNIQDISKLTSESEDVNGDGKIDLYDGGFVMEISWAVDGVRINTLHGVPMALSDPDLEENESSWTRNEIVQHITGRINNAESTIFRDNNRSLSEVINVDSFVEWFLMNDYVSNCETEFRNSCYLTYNPKDGLFYMGPDWDYDKAFYDLYDHYPANEKNSWYHELLKNEDFVNRIKQRWEEVKPSIRTTSEWINSEFSELEKAIEMDYNRWGFYNPKETKLLAWIENRIEVMDKFINRGIFKTKLC